MSRRRRPTAQSNGRIDVSMSPAGSPGPYEHKIMRTPRGLPDSKPQLRPLKPPSEEPQVDGSTPALTTSTGRKPLHSQFTP